jgi:Ion channel
MKFKLLYTDLDNIFNTGIFKWMCLEILCMAMQPYPSVHNEVYYEEANNFSAGIAF